MHQLAVFLIALAALGFVYTYFCYPLLLRLVGRMRPSRPAAPEADEWPTISISVPAYNEETQIAGVIESLLRLDYPANRRQILVVSDASSDGTDRIVESYRDRGVELLRMPCRGGKTAAENAARAHLRGEIVVNTDASIRIAPNALKPLIAAFREPAIGLASGRDVSVTGTQVESNSGESGYVGYEMGVRALETRVESIVGASGCFYAIRAHLHGTYLPDALSRDFAAAMITREHGYRAVSVDAAVCYVPRTQSLHREYRRKVRTITRGMQTLWYKRHLLDPVRYPLFAWMLFSHKVCRWLLPWALLGGVVGIALLADTGLAAQLVLALALGGIGAGALGWALSDRVRLPRPLMLPAFLVAGNVAAIHAGIQALRGSQNRIWEPTRRDVVVAR